MQQELDGCYLAAEKLMALREPSLPYLESLIMKIECQFSEVMQTLERLQSSSALMKKAYLAQQRRVRQPLSNVCAIPCCYD